DGLQFGTDPCVAVEAVTQDAGLSDDIEGVLVTVKSYATREVGEWLRTISQVPILSMQNGLGNGEALAEQIDSRRLAVGLTTYGATAEGDVKVHEKGRGNTVIGNWDEEEGAAGFWCDLLTKCGHQATLASDIRTEVWRKAMINIGINPFTALFDRKNGELLDDPQLLRWMQATVSEAESVARAEGIQLTDSFSRVMDVCRLTAANHSSMLQDKRHGRQTEIDSLCGVIVRLGEKHGLATPFNSLLTKLVKGNQTADRSSQLLSKVGENHA
ncbi:MAG: 2-dehydropantoate 2-reductase, partial [Tumebacillaceae bacterium]